MSRATPDDQVKFLLSCIKFCNNGKIDFVEVARECNVVSKGAAAKRYERLQKAVGYQISGGPSTEKSTSDTPQRVKKTNKAETPQKRKREDQYTELYKREGDEDTKSRPHVKREKIEMSHMQESHMPPRGPTYNPYLSPHPSYMHGAMPHYLHQSIRSTPHYPMMPPQHMQYGHVPNIGPNHQFMMPQQSMQTISMPQTVQSASLHDVNLNPATYDDTYHADSLGSVNISPTSFQTHNPLDAGMSNPFAMTSPSGVVEQQAISAQPLCSDLSMKQERDTSPLPDSFLDYLSTDIKVEMGAIGREKSTDIDPTQLLHIPIAKTVDPMPSTKTFRDDQSLNQTSNNEEITFAVKEEDPKSTNECIFISD